MMDLSKCKFLPMDVFTNLGQKEMEEQKQQVSS